MSSRATYLPRSFDRWDRADGTGSELVLLAYVMFVLAFVLPFMAPVGAVLAYLGRPRAGAVARSHFDRQITLFWHSLLMLLGIGLLHAAIAGLGAITFGAGLVLMVVPWALGLGWMVWAAWQVGSGLLSAWRRQPVMH